MNAPQFIAIDASSWEDHAHPIAIAWSLSDGRIKTTLIQPEDDWDDWDYALEDIHGINQDTLYQRGETCWSVIRELEGDLHASRLYADQAAPCQHLLERIYDACQREPSFEVDATDTPSFDGQQLPCDERVYAMLQAWAEQHGTEGFSTADSAKDGPDWPQD
ncbi:hypothetical protein CHH28_12100 [Bacterioplanes sanyensis]|uniref:Uncharacterized protein n=1 Tax=Bacterioplanes sanyensis TaxID=1249553 RepID=A0A222FK25_9GAMM|nr:hypothetical protein [Bacterioplanes sanyensis]ASP39368.1 hypothetical protein CHH28_12100 [Bacterioplanes sanyensis]